MAPKSVPLGDAQPLCDPQRSQTTITCDTNGTDGILVTSTFSTLKIDFSTLEIDFSSLEIAFGTLKFVSSTLKITSKHFEMDAGCVLAL